jgi:2-oxoglutarate ferredoxin oxidoreductase subunit alpha
LSHPPPPECFTAALEATRIALTYRTPVFLLSDGYLANGSEPWRIPTVDELPDLSFEFATGLNHELEDGSPSIWPYKRDPQTLVRPRHARPRPPHRRHREGGRHRQHLLRPGQPRLHGPNPAGQG